MKPTRVPVSIPGVGLVKGRNAIYLDALVHSVCPSIVKVRGEINITLCTDYLESPGKWIAFELIFSRVKSFRGWEVDSYPSELDILSSFDVIAGPEELQAGEKDSLYILATYDYVYELSAESFKIDLGKVRASKR